ncbi:MAG: hypothetical protein WBQ44_13905 [Rhodococcus sp. (in: high G+C Gram-positive bacteria)]
MKSTSESLRELYESAPNARLILAEGVLALDVPKGSAGDDIHEDVADAAVVVFTREALMERLRDRGTTDPSPEFLDEVAPVVDEMAVKLGA